MLYTTDDHWYSAYYPITIYLGSRILGKSQVNHYVRTACSAMDIREVLGDVMMYQHLFWVCRCVYT